MKKLIFNPIFLRARQKSLTVFLAVACCAPPVISKAQVLEQYAVSNGATEVSGGNYTGFASAGQTATYLYSNGTQIATQGIILNQISGQLEFTFELSGTLTENQALKSGSVQVKAGNAVVSGPALANATINLIDAATNAIFATTQTDGNGFFQFPAVPYRVFYFLVNSSVIPATPVILDFKSNIFIEKVAIQAEVGTEGTVYPEVKITPAATCSPDNPDYKIWYFDFDNDGFGNAKYSVGQCTKPVGYVLNSLDCNDFDASVNPDASDIAGSGRDNNCDGMYLWYVDADGDHFGSALTIISANGLPGVGESANNLDCDDSDPNINPDANDVPGTGIDANCDGILPCSTISNWTIIAPTDPVNISSSVTVSANLNGATVLFATWDWGDNTSSTGTIQNGIISGNHLYTSPGVYTLQILVENDCQLKSVFDYKYVVVYDPEGDFVTGSGTIFSPAGASPQYPNATGTASFGFVSKYDKTKTVPKGNTEFKFIAGNLSFVSTSYEWLVVSGNKAKFKGRGTVNGIPGFQFMISAIDGDLTQKGNPDLFRIKIWNEQTGVVVYDNEMNRETDADPKTSIQSGSIVVHGTKPKTKSGIVAENDGKSHDAGLTVFPNPTSGKIIVRFFSEKQEHLQLFITNALGQRVLEKIVSTNMEVELDLNGNAPGVYLINTIINNELHLEKIILQK